MTLRDEYRQASRGFGKHNGFLKAQLSYSQARGRETKKESNYKFFLEKAGGSLGSVLRNKLASPKERSMAGKLLGRKTK